MIHWLRDVPREYRMRWPFDKGSNMRVKTGLINNAAPAAQQRLSREEDRMNEDIVRGIIDERLKELGLLPTAETAPPFPPEPTTSIKDAFRNYTSQIIAQAVADLGPAGLAKLAEGWSFYLAIASAESLKRSGNRVPTNAAIARCLVVAWREAREVDAIPRSRPGTLLVHLIADVICPNEPEPKVWRKDPLGREKWDTIPASERWLAKELAAQHTGGSGPEPDVVPPLPDEEG